MHIELLGQFYQRLLAPYGSQSHLGLESGAVISAGSLWHRFSCSRQSCRLQAENPLIPCMGIFWSRCFFLASSFFFHALLVIVIRGEPALRAPGARNLVFG
jgi:hypothetical protein